MVSEKEIIPIRIKFSKLGDLMYISHLDLARTMQRIIVRSGIDIWYSEGFNPQPKIVFAVPLPVGVESECELMDIKINTHMEIDEIKQRISKNFPAQMKLLDVYIPEVKFKNIAYIDYSIRIYSKDINADTCIRINELFKSECRIIKKSKSGEKEINISEYVNSVGAELKDGFVEISAILSADNDRYLNPELFIEAIKQDTGLLSSDDINEYYTILRNKMLNNDLTEFR